MNSLTWLSEADAPDAFPPASRALREPDGLLAAGGDLSPERVLAAYERGIFPWYSSGQPVLWWSPDPRAVLLPAELKVSRSLRKRLRTSELKTRLDTAFAAVIAGCAAPRSSGSETWLTTEMIAAYRHLHALGYAHSVEVWRQQELVGGLYGLCLGRVFFGESMFSRVPDASKIALVRLTEEAEARGIVLIDCQQATAHLHSMGSRLLPREEFLALLRANCRPHRQGKWRD